MTLPALANITFDLVIKFTAWLLKLNATPLRTQCLQTTTLTPGSLQRTG